MLTRSRTQNQQALLTETYVDTEPKTYNQAKDHPHWVEAMNKEHTTLLTNQTWELVPPSPEQNVVGCRWVFKIKRRADGSLERYKARLVAKGFHQEEGIDFFDTFSPVIRPTTIRLHYFLDIEVHRSSNTLHLSQTKYLKEVLTRAKMLNANSLPSPMCPKTTLSKADGDPFADPYLYRSIVGALQYATLTRPDITFSVNKVS
jgi:Reverse transcriptase (RNA-dependent DNA polymerase)